LEYGRCFKRSTCTYEYKSLTRRLSVQEGSDCNGKGAIIQYNVMTFQNNIWSLLSDTLLLLWFPLLCRQGLVLFHLTIYAVALPLIC
jgi:hypothetical protein